MLDPRNAGTLALALRTRPEDRTDEQATLADLYSVHLQQTRERLATCEDIRVRILGMACEARETGSTDTGDVWDLLGRIYQALAPVGRRSQSLDDATENVLARS